MRIWLLVLLAALGCRTPPNDAADGDQALDASGTDAATDAPPSGCATHRLTDVQLAAIETLDDAPPTVFTTARVRLRLTMRACDLLGPIDVTRTIGNATDGIELRARVWQGSCGGPAFPRFVALAFAQQNMQLIFRDLNGPAALTIAAVADTNPGCAPAGPGNACRADCQCSTQPMAGCVLGATSGACFATCTTDLDCHDPARPGCVPPSALPTTGVCASGSGCSGGCAFPARCSSGGCQPPPTGGGGRCACQADCAPTQICDGEFNLCVTPCSNDSGCARPLSCVSGRCMPLA